MGKDIRKWYIDWRNLGLIFPYEISNNKLVLIDENSMKKNFPLAWKYFTDNKPFLDKREGGKWKNKSNWHAFVYEKNLEKFESQKIMTQVLANKNSFTFDKKEHYYFVGGGNAGGYGIILKKDYVNNYYYLLAILNSKLLEFYLKKISSPFRGGFYSYGRRFIEHLPIVFGKENEINHLSELSERQLDLGNRLSKIKHKETDEKKDIENQIKENDSKINTIVYAIYGIKDSEIRIIEANI